jgi:hypothetical protein
MMTPQRNARSDARSHARAVSLCCISAFAGASTLGASAAYAQGVEDGVVVGNDNVNDGLLIRRNGAWERLPFLGSVFGVAADPTTCTLYIASNRALDSGRTIGVLYRLRAGEPFAEQVADLTALSTDGVMAMITMVGLAWRPTSSGGELIGYRSVTGTPEGDVAEGFYRINTTTGICLPIWRILTADRAKWDFGGIDADPVTGELWGVNDNSSATFTTGGIAGLYRINLSNGAFTLVTGYPSSTAYPNTGIDVRDIDGLAVGGGRVWLVPDEVSTTIRPYIPSLNIYGPAFDLPTPFTTPSLSATFSGGAYAPCFLLPRCDSIDFNGDSLFPDDADLVDFLAVLAGGTCSTGTCNSIDFNNDGLFPDDQDLIAFLRVLAGGNC